MRLNELTTRNDTRTTIEKELLFITKIRKILGTTKFELPKFIGINTVAETDNALGGCYWQPGENKVSIEIKKQMFNNAKTVQRVLAHELCHEADYLLHWLPMINEGVRKASTPLDNTSVARVKIFLKSFTTQLHKEGHGKSWNAFKDKLNAIYGKDYVTKFSDESYEI